MSPLPRWEIWSIPTEAGSRRYGFRERPISAPFRASREAAEHALRFKAGSPEVHDSPEFRRFELREAAP